MISQELAEALVLEEDHDEYDDWELKGEEENYHKHSTVYTYTYFQNKVTGRYVCVCGLRSYDHGWEFESVSEVKPVQVTTTNWVSV